MSILNSTFRIHLVVYVINIIICFMLQDVLEVKKNLSRVNGLISVIATLIIFNYFELAVIGNYSWIS